MIFNKISFSAFLFIPEQQIVHKSEFISTLLKLFDTENLYPNTLLHSEGWCLMSHNEEWVIRFLQDRIIITNNHTDTQGTNLKTLSSFVNDSLDKFTKINTVRNQIPNRAGLVVTYLITDFDETQFQNLYQKLFHTLEFYKVNTPFEWDYKLVAPYNVDFNNNIEIVNAITLIKRYKGTIVLENYSEPFDAVELMIDLNTDRKNLKDRFNEVYLRSFLEQLHKEIDNIFSQTKNFIES